MLLLTGIEVICNVHRMNKEDCVRISNELKLFSNVAGVGLFRPWCGRPIDMIEVWSIKLEMNHSAHQKRDDWRLGGFQSNTLSTEVVNLFCWNRKVRKTFFRVTFSGLICKHSLSVNIEENT